MKPNPPRGAPARPAWRGRPAPGTALNALALGLCLALGTAVSPATHAQGRASEPVVLNFVGAEIEAVARTMATISGRNVVVDPRVRGTINLATERPVSPAAALNQFAAVLRLQGFALVDTGGLYKIVPEADAKLQGTVVSAGSVSALPASNQIVTQIFRLNHEAANNLVPVLRPLIGPNNTINVNPGNNSLVITDYADNLQRIGRIIAALDVAGATDVEVIPLQHAVAADLAALVQRLIDAGGATGGGAPGAAQGDTSYRTTLVAEPRSNSLVLRVAIQATNPGDVGYFLSGRDVVVALGVPRATSEDAVRAVNPAEVLDLLEVGRLDVAPLPVPAGATVRADLLVYVDPTGLSPAALRRLEAVLAGVPTPFSIVGAWAYDVLGVDSFTLDAAPELVGLIGPAPVP
jgi:hypothetical protein